MCIFLGLQSFKAIFKHFRLVFLFFISSVVLLSADIVTDIVSAIDFFRRGDTYWGLFTLVPIFAPFAVRSVITLINICQCFKYKKMKVTLKIHLYLPTTFKKNNKYDEWLSELKQLNWHFPMIQPIRSVKCLIHLNLKLAKNENWKEWREECNYFKMQFLYANIVAVDKMQDFKRNIITNFPLDARYEHLKC